MPELKYFEAVREGLAAELRRDPSVILMGEDVGHPGGIFAQTRGLQEEFGTDRVMDTPAGEVGFLGAAVGCALTGLRPVVEISFADFFLMVMDGMINQASKIRFMSGGQATVPLTVISFAGGGLNAGAQHSGTYEAVFGAVPGLKTVTPATPRDAKGMLITAIRDDNPTAVLFHKGLLGQRGEVPDGDFSIPFGQAEVVREGGGLSIVCWSGARRRAIAAAEELAASGVSAEVIDLRSIQPLDLDTVVGSVKKTRRLLIVQETIGFSGIGAEIAAAVGNAAFDYLDAPIERLSAPFVHPPFSPPLERAYLPQTEDVVSRARALVGA